jgi:hypothetical protein
MQANFNKVPGVCFDYDFGIVGIDRAILKGMHFFAGTFSAEPNRRRPYC